MFKKKVCKIGKGIKHFVEEKVQACKEILSNAQNRLILGFICLGVGVGFVASAYIKVPN